MGTVDLGMLDELRDAIQDAGPELLRGIIVQFAEEAPGQLGCIERSVIEGDLDGAARLAHRLRGSCGTLGLTDLSRMLGVLEVGLRGDGWAAEPGLVRRCRGELELGIVALLDYAGGGAGASSLAA